MDTASLRKLLSHIRIDDINNVRDIFASDPKGFVNEKSIRAIFETAAVADSSECIKIAFEYFMRSEFPKVQLADILKAVLIKPLIKGYEKASREILDCINGLVPADKYQEYVNLTLRRVSEQKYGMMIPEASHRISALNVLVDKGADINDHTIIHNMLMNNDIETAAALISHEHFNISSHQGPDAGYSLIRDILDANRKEKNESGKILYMPRPRLTADKVRLMRLFFEKGGDPDNMYDGITPLSAAAINNDYESMVLLLDAGADPNIRNDCAKQLEDLAREAENSDIAKLIEERTRQKILQKGIGKKEKSLISAICQNDAAAVLEAINNGADVNFIDKPNKNRITAFMCAVSAGADTEIFRILLENGFDPNMTDLYGNNAVDLLSLELYPFKDIVARDRRRHTFIYNRTEGQKSKTYADRSIYHKAADTDLETYKYRLAKVASITEMLIAAGADMNAGNRYWPIIGNISIQKHKSDDVLEQSAVVSSGLAFTLIDAYNYVVNSLIGNYYIQPASRMTYSNNGLTGEERRAAEKTIGGIISKMLAAGLDPNSKRAVVQVSQYQYKNHMNDPTLLHAAAAAGMPETVRRLLEAGADPNAENPYGGTPLYLSIPNTYINSKFSVLSGYTDQQTADAERDLDITENTIKIIDMIADAGGILKTGDSIHTSAPSLSGIVKDNSSYHMFPVLKSMVLNLENYLSKRRILIREDAAETNRDDLTPYIFDII